VLKSLTLLSKSKSLSFREKRMLDRARFLIITEVAEVTSRGATSVEGILDQALSKCIAARSRNIEKAKAAKTPVKVATVKLAVAKRAKAS
jgi:CarD family transcriptional regulator